MQSPIASVARRNVNVNGSTQPQRVTSGHVLALLLGIGQHEADAN